MAVRAIHTREDGLLGALAPLGLGAAAGTALVIDLDEEGPTYPGTGSLAQLVAEGPRRIDLSPARPGLAVLRNGGIDAESAAEVIAAVVTGWPAVILRLPRSSPIEPDLLVQPLVPGGLFPSDPRGRTVYQDLGFRLPADGLVLPPLGRGAAAALLAGTVPLRSSWVRAWKALWD